jgi:hypothetical protein
MKIFIKDLNIEKELHLYDSDGNDFAEEFILFFWDNGIEFIDINEQRLYGLSSHYSMTKNIFNNWVTILNRRQAIIDSIEKHKLNVENNEYYMY